MMGGWGALRMQKPSVCAASMCWGYPHVRWTSGWRIVLRCMRAMACPWCCALPPSAQIFRWTPNWRPAAIPLPVRPES
ncbi:hypothetical protein G6F68_020093 [Rhizopus microsporus]|nr:hypothetical protein G6F68_020093 [Rhizopus microsporus]